MTHIQIEIVKGEVPSDFTSYLENQTINRSPRKIEKKPARVVTHEGRTFEE